MRGIPSMLKALAILCALPIQRCTSFLFPSSPFEQPAFGNGPCGGTMVPLVGSAEAFESAIPRHLPPIVRGASDWLAPKPRNVTVWLPPSYFQAPDESFPVLYCHDGQNAVDDSESWTGYSWRLCGALSSLTRRNLIQCPIVVLIPSSQERFELPGMPNFVRRRHLEYEGGVWGKMYVDILADDIKPLVDAQFRTRRDAKHNMSIGTSMGGQIAFLSALHHPDKFGGAAALSPYFSSSLLATLALNRSSLRGQRLYIDNGGDLDDTRVPLLDILDHMSPRNNPGFFWLDTQLQPAIDAARAILRLDGIPHAYQKIPGGRHNERAWAKRIDQPLKHLFGTP